MPSEVGIRAPTVLNLDIVLFSPGWKLAQPSPCQSFWCPELAEAALTVPGSLCLLCPLYDSQRFCLQGTNWRPEGGLRCCWL